MESDPARDGDERTEGNGEPAEGEATRLLQEIQAGDPGAADALYRLVFAELKRLAAGMMGRERADHTLQPSALVNEAYLRLVRDESSPENRGQFLAMAGHAMYEILVEHARRVRAEKRGGRARRVELAVEPAAEGSDGVDVLDVAEALARLAARDPEAEAVARLRFFGGLTEEEIGAALRLTRRAVQVRWERGYAFLSHELG